VAGRIDEAAHGAAVARIFEVSHHHEAIRQHLNEVLDSTEFRGSRRSQEFLRKVVEYALEGDFDSLKERILGISIFGRDATYDTSEDAIVRVTASDVRRRLKQYYGAHSPSSVRIELPSGSYIPVFQCDEPAEHTPPALQAPREESTAAPLPTVPLPAAPSPAVLLQPQLPSRPETLWEQRRIGRTALVAALCAGCLLLGGAMVWLFEHRPAKTEKPIAMKPSEQTAMYRELLGPVGYNDGVGTDIVLSNPYVLLYKGETTPLSDTGTYYTRQAIPVPRDMEKLLNEYANDGESELPFHHLEVKGTSYTTAGEAEAAFLLRGLFDSLGRPSALTQARFLNWEAAKSHHIVLLGAPYLNEWTKSNLISPGFVLTRDAILNSHPQKNEQSSYKLTFGHDWLNDYGVIWMSENPSGSRILVLAGTTGTGTGGVGSFFANPSKMKAVYDRLRAQSPSGNIPPNWQALVRIEARENVPLQVSLVAVHVLPSSSDH